MSVRVPTPDPNRAPMSPDEIPTDPERDDRAPAPPDGDGISMPDVMNPIQ